MKKFERIEKITAYLCHIVSWQSVAAVVICGFFVCLAGQVGALDVVPTGNRNVIQPPVPEASIRRTGDAGSSFEAKYDKIHALLQKDVKLRRHIRKVARDYGLDPVHIAGAIVGEHTYNVDVLDRLQVYYVKGMSWAGQNIVFAYQGERVSRFVQRPQFAACHDRLDSNRLWQCREDVWNSQFRGRLVDGTFYPKKRFSAVFFQPFFAGQTFGLGQLNPLTALMMSDLVHKVSGLPKLSADNGKQLYRTIMDPDSTLPYIAAVIRQSIDDYQQIAAFDISKNPGLTATLYNIGSARVRAQKLATENRRRQATGAGRRYPQENYYGWLVNSKLDDLEKLFSD